MQKHLQQVLILLSEVLQALLGLCLVGCQVHNKALQRPILCLHDCAIVQTSLSLRIIALADLGHPKRCRAMQCTAVFQLSRRLLSYRP